MIQTAATAFFLILGQADGFATGDADYGSGLALIPNAYPTHDACVIAGEAAREYNAGLSFLSYTCVPAPVQTTGPVDAHSPVAKPMASRTLLQKSRTAAGTGRAKL